MKRFGLLVLTLLVVGCGETIPPPAPRQTRQFEPGSKVMTEEYRQATVNQMEKQGANRAEADAFTRELNRAQREWEQSK